MLNNLCTDIIYELIKYLSFKEICIIKSCNKKSQYTINSLDKNIIKYHLKLYYKYELYDEHRYRMKNNDLYNFYNFIQINMNNFYNSKLIIISDNHFVNELYKKIMMYCLQNKCNISGYPYLFDLFIFYILLNVDTFNEDVVRRQGIYNNIYNKYVINFLNLSTPKKHIYKDIFYDIKIKYYSYINSYIHNKSITIDYSILDNISRYLISTCALKKIFTYKSIDLKYTKLYQCCHFCAFKNIKQICNIKSIYYKDALISENYNKIKSFFKKKNADYYNYLLNRETLVVNYIIYIKNPINNRRMRINGNFYKKKMLEIYTLDYKIYKDINKCIKSKREFLKNKFFS
jgi:hypothetical protein